MTKYIVIIGHIINSKKSQDRYKLQKRFHEVMELLNKVYTNCDYLVSSYMVTLGDEFACVLSEAGRPLPDIKIINVLMYPVRFRFSIGIGNIDTELNTEQCIGMDGDAFHCARDGMNTLKGSRLIISINTGQLSDIEINDKFDTVSLELEPKDFNTIVYSLEQEINSYITKALEEAL